MSDLSELKSLLSQRFPSFTSGQVSGVLSFYELLVAENAVQNLTRLISPLDFVDGHLQDAAELLKCGFLSTPCLDLGSGGGVPGLLCAILSREPWFLVDSEKSKADFLLRVTQALALSETRAIPERAEAFLKRQKVGSVVARAVGKVEKIYSWIGTCSTWNNLVLLKGPGWASEWEEFEKSRFRRELAIEKSHEYSVGVENKQRIIVLLKRVPRGTIKSRH
jgi:16S rRNA (guanine527-N7)-methyltransferase